MEKWGTISLSSVCSEFETKGTMTMGHGKGPLLEYVCSCMQKCLWNPVPPIMQTYLINLLVPKREEHHSVRCNQSTVFFSHTKLAPASQQYFSLTINQHHPPATAQRTECMSTWATSLGTGDKILHRYRIPSVHICKRLSPLETFMRNFTIFEKKIWTIHRKESNGGEIGST